ncbi:MAG: sensor histidine kinase RegB [Pseudorhodobacter sp.]
MAFGADQRPLRGSEGRLRLQTLILLRWMAITGQSVALIVAYFGLRLDLPMGLCAVTIGLPAIANLIFQFIFPASTRLSERHAVLVLLFDLAQLAFLLSLTGGLTNPFALLIIAPVVISASALDLRATVFLGSMAIIMLTAAFFLYVPLRFFDGTVLTTDPLFIWGNWAAIVIGILFLGTYSYRVASEIDSMSRALLATQMALAREQKLTDLGGVVAAAAHELGTPLATIKLISTELMEDLAPDSDLRDDARTIRDQANRCRDILHSMGRAGKEDMLIRRAPLDTVLQEAAEPHMQRGKEVIIKIAPTKDTTETRPQILRKPEVIHGLRNLVQNAVDFARGTVWIDARWSDRNIRLTIVDDGPGYPTHLIGRIGDPFVRRRKDRQINPQRPGYEGMGLGLFIAKTLLERTGAELSFANASGPTHTDKIEPQRRGAIVEVIWPIEALRASETGSLGENRPFLP